MKRALLALLLCPTPVLLLRSNAFADGKLPQACAPDAVTMLDGIAMTPSDDMLRWYRGFRATDRHEIVGVRDGKAFAIHVTSTP